MVYLAVNMKNGGRLGRVTVGPEIKNKTPKYIKLQMKHKK